MAGVDASKVMPDADRFEEASVQPAICPDVAVTAPAAVTLNEALASSAAPSHILPSMSTWNEEASAPPISIVPPVNAPEIVSVPFVTSSLMKSVVVPPANP